MQPLTVEEVAAVEEKLGDELGLRDIVAEAVKVFENDEDGDGVLDVV